ncbi:MAG: hypothetical protein ACXVP0_07485 [Bacteroidia bacterium]
MRKRLLILFSFISVVSFAQIPVGDSCLSFPLVAVNYSFQMPFGDLKNRFGPNSSIGGSFLYKFKKNWVVGLDGGYLFSKQVKEDVLKQMKNSDGYIIDNDGFPADLRVFERGFDAYVVVGRIFSALGRNPNSGLIINLGFGYLQHKIKFYDANKAVAAVKDNLKKGYDRLTGGYAMHQYIGYEFFSDNRLINFTAGFEFHEALTKSYRGFNYDTGLPDTKTRFDCLIGVRVGWILPLYKRTPTYYFN